VAYVNNSKALKYGVLWSNSAGMLKNGSKISQSCPHRGALAPFVDVSTEYGAQEVT
jgi:hypothetical protein